MAPTLAGVNIFEISLKYRCFKYAIDYFAYYHIMIALKHIACSSVYRICRIGMNYLPGNGALLLAVGMAAGGCDAGHCVGFPLMWEDAGVKAEGFIPFV